MPEEDRGNQSRYRSENKKKPIRRFSKQACNAKIFRSGVWQRKFPHGNIFIVKTA